MPHINDIIAQAVADLRRYYTIMDIVDNTGNVYTVQIEEDIHNQFAEVLQGEVIEISNTVGFNGEYKVQSIDYGNLTFTISKTSGIAIPGVFGIVSRLAPYFYYEYIPGLNQYLTDKTMVKLGQRKKFPLVYLSLDYDIQDSTGSLEEVNGLVLYVINRVIATIDAPQRHATTMPYLRLMRLDVIDRIQRKSYKLLKGSRKEIYYGKPNENLGNEVTDAIRFNIDIKYCSK